LLRGELVEVDLDRDGSPLSKQDQDALVSGLSAGSRERQACVVAGGFHDSELRHFLADALLRMRS
jgi:hypothetical protein